MFLRRLLCLWIAISFASTLVVPPQNIFAQTVMDLPAPGTMVSVSPSFEPALIKGLTVHKDNPFLFDFIVDPGQDVSLRGASFATKQSLKEQSLRMIKYFFAALTIPDKDIWVNLSPYEKDRMIPASLGVTAMGRDLLAQDYMLKQLTASLIYPQKALGKTFWSKVYAQAKAMYGTTQVPVNTFNKVWIVPQKAGVYERGQTAFIVSGHLKVMLEEDYLSLQKHSAISSNTTHTISSQIIKQIILPEIEKEINEGKNFSTLRQIFYAQVLAVWFKRNLKQALLNQVYANKSTIKGIDQNDAATNEAIYHQYLRAYKKGVFNYIKEDIDPITQETLPRKYFSGGWAQMPANAITPAMITAADIAAVEKKDFDFAVLAATPNDAAKIDFAMAHKPLQKVITTTAALLLTGTIASHIAMGQTIKTTNLMSAGTLGGGYYDSGNNFTKFVQNKGIVDLDLVQQVTFIASGKPGTNCLFRITPTGVDPAKSLVGLDKTPYTFPGTGDNDEVESVTLPVGEFQLSSSQLGKVIQEVVISGGGAYNNTPGIQPIHLNDDRHREVHLLGINTDRPVNVLVSKPAMEQVQWTRPGLVGASRPVSMSTQTNQVLQNVGVFLIESDYEGLLLRVPLTVESGKAHIILADDQGQKITLDTSKLVKEGRIKNGVLTISLWDLHNMLPVVQRQYSTSTSPDQADFNFWAVKISVQAVSEEGRLSIGQASIVKGNEAMTATNQAWLFMALTVSLTGELLVSNNKIDKLKGTVHTLSQQVQLDRQKIDALTVQNLKLTQVNSALTHTKFVSQNTAHVDHAVLTNPTRGGIDLSQQDAALHVEKDPNGGVKVTVDQALIARIERDGMPEVDPVIIDMQPADIKSLFGVGASVLTH